MYQPQQREVLCTFLTAAGWIRGNLVLHKSHALREHIETSRASYLKLIDVELPTGKVPFFALSREQISLIIPSPDSERLTHGMPAEGSVSRRITCVMAAGMLEGNVTLKKGVRVSDHIEQRGNFLFLDLCVLHAGAQHTTLAVVIANTKHIIGIADSADMP
jgi:hypothetical protein